MEENKESGVLTKLDASDANVHSAHAHSGAHVSHHHGNGLLIIFIGVMRLKRLHIRYYPPGNFYTLHVYIVLDKRNKQFIIKIWLMPYYKYQFYSCVLLLCNVEPTVCFQSGWTENVVWPATAKLTMFNVLYFIQEYSWIMRKGESWERNLSICLTWRQSEYDFISKNKRNITQNWNVLVLWWNTCRCYCYCQYNIVWIPKLLIPAWISLRWFKMA